MNESSRNKGFLPIWAYKIGQFLKSASKSTFNLTSLIILIIGRSH